jgi:hypothetical protein
MVNIRSLAAAPDYDKVPEKDKTSGTRYTHVFNAFSLPLNGRYGASVRKSASGTQKSGILKTM